MDKKIYGFYSENAVKAGATTCWYRTPEGGEVEVFTISEHPTESGAKWPDVVALGEVTVWLKKGRARRFESE